MASLTGWYLPMPQDWQPARELRPLVFDHVPGGHCWKTDALLAARELAAWGLVRHAAAKLAKMPRQAAQRAHEDCPAVAAYVPGAHTVALIDPMEQKKPTGHELHSLSLDRPKALENVPAGHGSSAAAPAAQ